MTTLLWMRDSHPDSGCYEAGMWPALRNPWDDSGFRIIRIFDPWHFFCLQLPASLPLGLPSYYFCYPVQPSSWWINGSPNRPWSLSSSLNPQERTLMDQQVPVPNNCVMRRWACLPWGHIWRGGESSEGSCRAHLLLGLPSSPSPLETAFSFLAPRTVWITWSVLLICHIPLWQQASPGLGSH